ncbi:hypothetical protein [Halocalculus aciditolerans]|uniref:Uncharacterized protein n=1 Tax=Halocalculus aciditolerans TaxID=1383812 RepID=A0A830FAH6_9EURY|nr:hypothetical protein [Halocalculus aciditolerans]GGL55242.1 hypothetical protein GCM10009039_11700 [Halocalculus aciditolerans]
MSPLRASSMADDLVREDLGLEDYAAQYATEELGHSDEAYQALITTANHLGTASWCLNEQGRGGMAAHVDDGRDAVLDLAEDYGRERAIESVQGVDVHGHRVDLRHSIRRDCPSCSENIEAYHIGTTSRGDIVLDEWVCGHCGVILQTGDATKRLTSWRLDRDTEVFTRVDHNGDERDSTNAHASAVNEMLAANEEGDDE